jgi:hypothetical protein
MASKKIGLIWGILAILIFLFPHFTMAGPRGESRDAGYGFLFTGPFKKPRDAMVPGYSVLQESEHRGTEKGWFRPKRASVDMGRFLILEVAVGAVAGLAMAFTRKRSNL